MSNNHYLFSYGTLQPGCSRFKYMEPFIESFEDGSVSGYSLALSTVKVKAGQHVLWGICDFPFAVKSEDSVLHGTLFKLDKDLITMAYDFLDRIECGYQKVDVLCHTEFSVIKASMYVTEPFESLLKVNDSWKNLTRFY